ncbi:MAG: PKD domain-containing protein [Planctomycetes bacterium]|nr:PKD domain-containing protein [Planctomycetota bacterium]
MTTTRSIQRWLLGMVLVTGVFAGTVLGQVNQQAILLLLDTSASMKQKPKGMQTSKAAEVKRQLGQFCVSLPRNTDVRIFTFDKTPVIPGPSLVVNDEASRQTLRGFFEALQTEGQFTYAWSALETVLGEARTMLDTEPTRTVWIYVYTDGEDNEQPPRNLEAILDGFDDLLQNRDQIRVSYITLGFELKKDVADAFARHGISVLAALRPEDWMNISPISADFDWSPWRALAASPIHFNDRSVGNIASHEWDFGDGNTSTEANPAHTYSSDGTYTVKLGVTGPGGIKQSRSRDLFVQPAGDVGPPQAMFEVNRMRGKSPLEVTFTNKSVGSIQTYVWDFGDGTEPLRQETSLGEVMHEFPAGEYTVTLTAQGPPGMESDRYTPDWKIVSYEGSPWLKYPLWALVILIILFILVDMKRRHSAKRASGG